LLSWLLAFLVACFAWFVLEAAASSSHTARPDFCSLSKARNRILVKSAKNLYRRPYLT
jgi:hypothetical protein